MSFLEMLDVVNEELIAEGRGADRLRPRLPRGHLRHLRLVINGVAPRAARRAPPPASSTCGSFKDGDDDHDRAVARRAPSRSSRTWSSTAAPSTASSPAGGFICGPHRQRARTATPSRSPRRTPSWRWTPPPASAAAPAWPPARTPRPCCSSRPRSRTSACCPQGQPERDAACSTMVAPMDAEGFGNCTNHDECEAACPKEISLDLIARMNRDFLQGEPDGRRRGEGRGGAG